MLAAVLAGALLHPVVSRSAPATAALAPDFALKDVRGHNPRLSDYRGAWVGGTKPMPELARQMKELRGQ